MNNYENDYDVDVASGYDAAEELVQSCYEPDAGLECTYVCGAAGTGKTYLMKKEIAENPKAGVLAATTGIAAVNLGTVTINSLLKFFDTASLTDLYVTGRLTSTIQRLALQYESIRIDEVSMMDGDQLDLLYNAALEANQRGKKKIKLLVCGDFCQLPPVKAKWAFEASCWEHFAANTRKLTKIWRQSDKDFLDALNLARAGKGEEAGEAFRNLVNWVVATDVAFDGTTIYGKNADVDRHNLARYTQLKGKEVLFRVARWGKQRGEWKLIQEDMKLKVGAYVMILTNAPFVAGQPLQYANGDCGHIVGFGAGTVQIRLVRNGDVVDVPFLTRKNESKEKPPAGVEIWHGYGKQNGRAYYDAQRKRWVHGGITFMPLRLAYATTVHKSQGLSLDKVQLDLRGHFMGSPGMVYVSLSRCRTAGGLRIVGSPEMMAKRISVDPKILAWI